MSDYDPPSAFWVTNPRARKRHRCGECRNDILPGEVYEKVAGIWSGEFDHHKTCSGCVKLRELLVAENVDWFFGGVFECMEESDHEIPAMEVLGAMGA